MQKERIITIVIAVIIAIIITAIAGFIIYRFIFRRQKDTPTIDDTSPDEVDETTDDEQNENDVTDEREGDLHGHGDQYDSLNRNINGGPSMNPFKGKVDVSDHDIRQFTSPQSTRHGSNESVKVITPTVRDLSMDDVIKNDVKESGSDNRKVNGGNSRGGCGCGSLRMSNGLFGSTGLFGPPIGVTIVTSKVGTWKENEESATPKVEEVSAVEMNKSSENTKVDVKDGHVRRRVRKHRKVNHDDVKSVDESGASETVNVADESEHEKKVEVSYPGFREQIETGDGIGSDMLMSFGDSVYEKSYGYYGVGSGAFF